MIHDERGRDREREIYLDRQSQRKHAPFATVDDYPFKRGIYHVSGNCLCSWIFGHISTEHDLLIQSWVDMVPVYLRYRVLMVGKRACEASNSDATN